MVRSSVILCVVGLILCVGCSEKPILDRSSFAAYPQNPESGFVKEKTINGISYRLLLELPEFTVLKNDPQIDAKQYQIEVEKQKGHVNFSLLIMDVDGADQIKTLLRDKKQREQLVEYANTLLPLDFRLNASGASYECSALHLEPLDQWVGVLRIALGFRGVSVTQSDYTLSFEDNLFKNGEINFKYPQSILNNLPALKL